MNRRSAPCHTAFTLVVCSLLSALYSQVLSGAAEPAAIDDFQYADATAAQKTWAALWGTAPVTPARIDGRPTLRFPCNFAGTTIERACWDRAIRLDLATSRGIQFDFFCSDSSPVSYFSLYFQSGQGWYHAPFFPESPGWNTITINKADTTVEGQPAGWGTIQTIRLSAWRAKDRSTEFSLGGLRKCGLLGEEAKIVIIRGESAAQASPPEARSIRRYAEDLAEHLHAADVGGTVLSDLDITADRLRGARLVVLPYNPSLPEPAADELARFIRTGGKLLAFYALPEKLQPVLGVAPGPHVKAAQPGSFSAIRFQENALAGAPNLTRQRSWNIQTFSPIPGHSRILADWLDDQSQPTGHAAVLGSSNGLVVTHVLLNDDASNKRRMLLAMVGSLVPELWQPAAQRAFARVGHFGAFTNFDQAAAQIAALTPDNLRVRETLARARALQEAAQQSVTEGRFTEAIDQAAKAGQNTEEAFCLAQTSLPGEFRAFWCHSAFGVEGLSWDEAVGRLAQNGFTAILPNMLWGGAAFYPTQVLPVAKDVAERGDQIALCLAACRKHRVQMHVWKVNWYLGSAAPKEFVERLRREHRLQAGSGGEELLWLCPSHPENRQLEIDAMVEVARRYEVDGLHFDYIRYPDSEHCFCAGCRQRFGRAAGVDVADWPKPVLAGGGFRAAWLEWRRSNITQVVQAVSQQARTLQPGLKISAAVFRTWSTDRDSVAQDWKLWCEKGCLDFVCPMDYTPSNRQFENMVAQQVEWAGRVPCYPGIGASASSSRFGPVRVIEQIHLTRRHGTRGFVIFNYGAAEAQELLPMLGLGITAAQGTFTPTR